MMTAKKCNLVIMCCTGIVTGCLKWRIYWIINLSAVFEPLRQPYCSAVLFNVSKRTVLKYQFLRVKHIYHCSDKT